MFSSQEGMFIMLLDLASIILNIRTSMRISFHGWDDSMIIAHHDDN